MVSVLQAAIRMAWVISLVSVSSFTMAGLCWESGIFAGTVVAAAWAASSSRGAGWTGASSRASILLVMTVAWPGAGLRRAASFCSRAAPARARAFFAVLTVAAAGFFAGFGTMRAGSSGVVAEELRASRARWARPCGKCV